MWSGKTGSRGVKALFPKEPREGMSTRHVNVWRRETVTLAAPDSFSDAFLFVTFHISMLLFPRFAVASRCGSREQDQFDELAMALHHSRAPEAVYQQNY